MKSPRKMPIPSPMSTLASRRTKKVVSQQRVQIHNGEMRQASLNKAINTLRRYWPYLFPHGILRPMALDIVPQLMADTQARKLKLTSKQLAGSVSVILHSVAYQATLMPGALRYHYNGKAQGVITEEDILLNIL